MSKANTPVPGAVIQLEDSKTLQVRSYIAQQDGAYHFYGLPSDTNFQIHARSGELTSPIKTVSVFDSRAKIVLNLKLKDKVKR